MLFQTFMIVKHRLCLLALDIILAGRGYVRAHPGPLPQERGISRRWFGCLEDPRDRMVDGKSASGPSFVPAAVETMAGKEATAGRLAYSGTLRAVPERGADWRFAVSPVDNRRAVSVSSWVW
jgi:hypothetical protein